MGIVSEGTEKVLAKFSIILPKFLPCSEMPSHNGKTYVFGDFRLIPGEGLLLRNGEPVPLSLKAFSTLVFLVERHGHLVQRSELIETVWEDLFVEDANISKCVWAIRNALGQESKSSTFIQTIPRRGYRFVAPVSVVDSSGAFRLSDFPGVDDNEVELVSSVEQPHTNGIDGIALTLAADTGEQEPSESSSLIEVSPDRVHENGNIKRNVTAARAAAVESSTKTKRRKGLRRGFKFLIWGIGVWFVFYVLLQALIISGTLFEQYKDDLIGRTGKSTVEMMGDLLVTILIPAGVGMFAGIGLVFLVLHESFIRCLKRKVLRHTRQYLSE